MILTIKTNNYEKEELVYTIEKVGTKYKFSAYPNKLLNSLLLSSNTIVSNMDCNSRIAYYLDDVCYTSSGGSGNLHGSSSAAKSCIEDRIVLGFKIMYAEDLV